MTVSEQKKKLRKRLREAAHGVPLEEKRQASARARGHLLQHPIWKEARRVLLYVPLRDEIDISPLLPIALKESKEVLVPRYLADGDTYEAARIRDPEGDLVRGPFGVWEPAAHCGSCSSADLDLLLIPGLGFSTNGSRVGRGLGYYDRLLADIRGQSCGVGFDFQIMETIPTEAHDALLDYLLTPTLGVRATERGRA